MFLIRRAKPEDVPTLLKLARMVHFINLPPDKQIIDEKVAWSRQCFLMAAETATAGRKPATGSGPGTSNGHGGGSGAAGGAGGGAGHAGGRRRALPESSALAGGLRALTGKSPLFMFVMEQLDNNGGVVGTSQIISKMGGPGHPNVALQLSRREMFSESLQVGVTHTVAKIRLDETGPTEIGGLILQPSLRGHRLKLGRFVAQVRFHFMGLYRQFFADRVLAEMMGPITADGHNPFWEYCTRCFINLTYEQADKFCQQSKEFILTLFPREEIYLTLIAPEARAVVGTVGPETVPAKRMLEKLGFKYYHRIDPFDGGPHLEAPTDSISLVQATGRAPLAAPADAGAEGSLSEHGYVSVIDADGEFRAVETDYGLDKHGRVVLPREAFRAMSAEPGMDAGVTPSERPEPLDAHKALAAGPAPVARAPKPRPKPSRKPARK